MEYSKVITKMEASPIRAMMVKAAAKDNVISLSPGQPDFIPEPNVIEYAKSKMEESSRYAPGAGIDSLRETYVEYLNDEIGTDYTVDNVMVTVGGMSALHLALSSILNPGDEVLVSEPYFTNYDGMIRMTNGTPVKMKVTEEDNFQVTAEIIEQYITDKTKAIILNSPCNPTGQVLDEDTITKIAELALKNDIFVISDEVYRHIIYDNKKFYSIASISQMKENAIVVDSCSKSSAMAGFRVGFLTGPQTLIELCTKAIENVYSCATTVCQFAAEEAIKTGADYRKFMCSEYEKRRNYLCDRIDKMPGLSCKRPQGAFYLYINVSKTNMTGEEFANNLLEKGNVAVVPGSSFGESGKNYIRISFATSMENLIEAFNRIEAFVSSI